MLAREAAALRFLATTAIPAPRLIAVDPGRGRLLMSRLPGAARSRVDDLDALARTLVAIHALVPARRPPVYGSWVKATAVPEWAGDARVWERALALIAAPAPPYRGCFLHRDYHPSNVLFSGATVSGVVDWTETSWGPADLDVAHCATNLAMRHGAGAPARMRAAYLAAGGRLAGDRHWALLDALGFLPEPEHAVPDLPAELVRARLEAYVVELVCAPSSLRASSSCS
jgi:aminoglycoside phosphotransferase (APT) family kinase protein